MVLERENIFNFKKQGKYERCNWNTWKQRWEGWRNVSAP